MQPLGTCSTFLSPLTPGNAIPWKHLLLALAHVGRPQLGFLEKPVTLTSAFSWLSERDTPEKYSQVVGSLISLLMLP